MPDGALRVVAQGKNVDDAGGIQPAIGPIAFDRPAQEDVHALIDLAAHVRDLAFADPLHAESLDQVIDGAGGDALDVGCHYLSLLGANFIGDCSDDSSFPLRVADAARAISDSGIERLLQIREWRGRLTVGWYIGPTRRSRFVGRIAELLLASEMVYAGMGYCIALGLIGGEMCASQLRAYLDKYLPLRGRFYNQGWPIGALAYIEGAPPTEFLDPALWVEGNQPRDLIGEIELFKTVTELIDKKKMMIT